MTGDRTDAAWPGSTRRRWLAIGLLALALTLTSCDLFPARVSFDPVPLLPDGYTVVFEDFEAAMMGAGPEFQNGYWLVAAPSGTTPARALARLSQAFTDGGFARQPARDDWQAEFADDHAWLHLKRYVADTTEVDNFAPEQQLLAAAHDHPGRPLIYLFATGNWSAPGP